MATTDIEWATHVWNFVRGCRRVSPGCGGAAGVGGCYAERQAIRHSGTGKPYEGLVQMTKQGPRWTGGGRFVPQKLLEPLTLKPRKNGRHRIFVNSMSDLFFEQFSNEQIAAGFGVMAACPEHDFLILTKRAARMRDWFAWLREDSKDLPSLIGEELPAGGSVEATACVMSISDVIGVVSANVLGARRYIDAVQCTPWPLPNVFLGVSAEDQQRADERVPLLLECPAAVRFVSAEPLLGPIDFKNIAPSRDEMMLALAGLTWSVSAPIRLIREHAKLDWVIVGGESGPGARPFNTRWGLDVIKQCADASVPAFFKQAGAHVLWDGVSIGAEHWPAGTAEPEDVGNGRDFRIRLRNRKGGDLLELPEALRVRQFPEARP